ncbi:MAG: hypothetical protein OEM63_10275 [Gammaproteobacteria bacterium]|nr:hypothetical protein [Gammaproteobacteria bacterium]
MHSGAVTDDQSPKRNIHPEMLVDISAVVIGVCALGVSMYETSLMREEQRAAVIPILELGPSFNTSTEDPSRNRFWLIAQNVGIGPARVHDFTVTVDANPQPTWDAAMRLLAGQDERVSHSYSVINGRTISPDRTVRMFELSDLELIGDILANYERLEFEACFCSIFDECWTTNDSTFGVAAPVEVCTISDSSFTE